MATDRTLRVSPGAALAGWLLILPINVVASSLRGGKGASVFAVAHVVGAGQLLAGGLLSAALVLAWGRLPAPAQRWGWLAVGLAAAVVGWFAVGPDFEGFVARVSAVESIPAGVFGSVACVAGVVGCGLASAFLTRRFWWVGLLIALLLGVINNLILELDYPGIHLILGWSAAIAATVSLGRRDPAWARPSKRLAIALAVAAPLAVASLVVRPGDAAWRRLLETPGAFPAPFVSQLLPELSVEGGDASDPWMRSRKGLTATRPSGLSPLGADGIVMLVVLDSLRADVVARDKPQVETPNLDRLRERAADFTLARSAAPSTLSSMTSTFTGKFYSQLHTKNTTRDEDVSDDDSPRVAEILARSGVKSFHVVPTRLLLPSKGATRGFDVVDVGEKKTSSVVLPKLAKHLEGGLPGRHFIYLHWMDAHSPYDLGGTEGSQKDAYLREVAIADKQLGELLALLEKSGVAQRTTLILTADHGEAFGEHDTWEHGKTVYEELLRVPLMIVAPSRPPRVVAAPVSTIDVGATIIDLFGAAVPGYWMGQSLLPLAYGDETRVDHPIAAEGGRRLRAFYSTDDVKVVIDRQRKTTEVYDLRADPGELTNLADDPAYKQHVDRARRFFAAHQVADDEQGEKPAKKPKKKKKKEK
jgi:arylsulfatase A-like enzyme